MSHRPFPRPLGVVLLALAAFVTLAFAGPAFGSPAKAGPINPQSGFPPGTKIRTACAWSRV